MQFSAFVFVIKGSLPPGDRSVYKGHDRPSFKRHSFKQAPSASGLKIFIVYPPGLGKINKDEIRIHSRSYKALVFDLKKPGRAFAHPFHNFHKSTVSLIHLIQKERK